jgi:predicted nuclease of predicted toxin-antitoxin system
MRFLANENFPLDAIELLKANHYDIKWIRTTAPGISDEEVLVMSVLENRILLSFDKDFGALVYQKGRQASCGIVLFRFKIISSMQAAAFVTNVLNQRNDWQGMFSVVSEDKIRMRPLP